MSSTFIHQRKYWNQSLVAEENLFTIKLDKSAGKCNCQLRVLDKKSASSLQTCT